jgi:hypothetical protein
VNESVVVITGWRRLVSAPAKVTTIGVPGSGPPLVVTFPVPIEVRARSAVFICAAVESKLIVAE